jgi:hypothetical protein
MQTSEYFPEMRINAPIFVFVKAAFRLAKVLTNLTASA